MGEVMVRFKKNYYKIDNVGSKLKIRVATYRAEPDYLYDAFKGADGDEEYMYIGAYPGSVRDKFGTLGSSSSDIPIEEDYRLIRTVIPEGYRPVSFDRMTYLFCISTLILKSMDFNRRIGTTNVTVPNGTMNRRGLFYGTLDGDGGNKFLGIENLWSDLGQIVEGLQQKDDKFYYKTGGGYNTDIENYTPLDTTDIKFGTGYISTVDGSTRFIYPTDDNGSSSTYLTSMYKLENSEDGEIKPITIGGSILGHSHLYNIDSSKTTGNMRLSY